LTGKTNAMPLQDFCPPSSPHSAWQPMKPSTTCRLALALAAFSLAGFAAANDAQQSAIAKLRQTGEVSCKPILPFFCANMHVSCAGQTSIETFAFKLRASRTHGSIDSASESESLQRLFENGRVDWDSAGAYVILHSSQMNSGYIKLNADGTYNFRYYPRPDGVMSLGRCN
jgi:uncharacterized membrane protein (DUF4010 family)